MPDVTLVEWQQPRLVVTVESLERTVVAGRVVEWRHVLICTADRLRQFDSFGDVVLDFGETREPPVEQSCPLKNSDVMSVMNMYVRQHKLYVLR